MQIGSHCVLRTALSMTHIELTELSTPSHDSAVVTMLLLVSCHAWDWQPTPAAQKPQQKLQAVLKKWAAALSASSVCSPARQPDAFIQAAFNRTHMDLPD